MCLGKQYFDPQSTEPFNKKQGLWEAGDNIENNLIFTGLKFPRLICWGNLLGIKERNLSECPWEEMEHAVARTCPRPAQAIYRQKFLILRELFDFCFTFE